MNLAARLKEIKDTLPESVCLVAVSKFHPAPLILEAYKAGQQIFGESRVQELVPKHEELPKEIEWHFIGHLQANKVKYIAPFIDTIQSADSLKIMNEINRQAGLFRRKIKVLLQIHIAQEEHKFGFFPDEVVDLLKTGQLNNYPNLIISGLMGMATFTDDEGRIRSEFEKLSELYRQLKAAYFSEDDNFKELSMGMSDDYPIAVEEGSTMIRIGSRIFGERK